MAKFRKLPVEVEAWRVSRMTLPMLHKLLPTDAKIVFGCGHKYPQSLGYTDDFLGIDIPTLEGVVRASPGDYLIRGVRGEF